MPNEYIIWNIKRKGEKMKALISLFIVMRIASTSLIAWEPQGLVSNEEKYAQTRKKRCIHYLWTYYWIIYARRGYRL